MEVQPRLRALRGPDSCLAWKYRFAVHNPLRERNTRLVKMDFEEAIVTALLAVGMTLLAAVTIMIFF